MKKQAAKHYHSHETQKLDDSTLKIRLLNRFKQGKVKGHYFQKNENVKFFSFIRKK